MTVLRLRTIISKALRGTYFVTARTDGALP